MRISFLPAMIIVALQGCAQVQPQPAQAVQMRYTNYAATQEQFLRDRYACLQETQQRVSGAVISGYGGAARSQVIPSCSAMSACLAARGYLRSSNGNLVVPPGTEIQCH